MSRYLILSLLALMLSLLYHCYFNEPLSIVERPKESYDYIVVGGGTAGCVLASRLSEISNVSVLLVEAGGYFNWLSTIPLAAPLMQASNVDWAYKTESQLFSSKGLWNYKQSLPRGKGLGGSGNLNYVVHSLGRPEDYDNWPKGWSHADLLPYFSKVVKTMNVMQMSQEEMLVKAFLNAEKIIASENVTFQSGTSTVKSGSRWSTYHAYLQNAWNRRNLHILMNTLVVKVIFHELRTIGIQVKFKDGTTGKIEAKKEVIICAGAINTPQLLMVSGIGPAEELNKHRIPVVRDLPEVGKNLFDHLNVPIYVHLDAPVSITLKKMQSVNELTNYIVFGTGLLASNGIMGLGRIQDSGVVLFGVASVDEKLLKEIANFHTETFRSLFPTYNDSSREGCVFLAQCLQPKSRGNVTLRSAAISDPPKIDPNYLEHAYDVSCTQEAINLVIRILGTRTFREFGAKIHVPHFEECRDYKQDYADNHFSECVMRISGLTSHHPGGTCRIGSTIGDSVVDEELRVRGLEGLRIMDASILPSPISGTPNSVIVALAEKAADILLNHH